MKQSHMMLVPALLMLIVGILMFSFSSFDPMLKAMGITYMLSPILIIAIYGPLAMLTAWIYNLFAKKFGGFKMELVELEDTKLEELE